MTERQALQTPAASARCATEASCGMTSATARKGKGILLLEKEFFHPFGLLFSPFRSCEMPEPSSKSAEYLASLMMGSGCDGDSLKANRTTQASVEPVCSPSSESRTVHSFF